MKDDIKQEWLEALRSGEYVQGVGALRDTNDQFCCLGVLCDIYARKGHGRWVMRDVEGQFGSVECTVWEYVTPLNEHATATLPNSIVDDNGLPGGSVVLYELSKLDHSSRELTALNDKGLSFARIANIIEKHL